MTPILPIARQRELLAFIAAHIAREGTSPTFAQMRDHLALASKSTVHRMVLCLGERGYVRRQAYRARGLSLTEAGWRYAAEHAAA